MASYLVRYTLGDNNRYIYPEGVAGVVWKSAVYHAADRVMIGETDAAVKADGKKVVALSAKEGAKQTEAFRASHPRSKEPPLLPFLKARAPEKKRRKSV